MKKIRPYYPTIFALSLCAIVPKSALVSGDWLSAFTYHFTHANIFHLAANAYAMYLFRPRWSNIPVSYVSATLAAFIPYVATATPTVGISGMIFAMFARRDAILGIWNWKLLAINLVLAFVPSFNWKIHLFSYIIAFVIWKIYLSYKRRRA